MLGWLICRASRDTDGQVTPLRLMASSMSGQWLRMDGFEEYPDPITGVTKQWCKLTQDEGDGEGMCMLNPYPASNSVQVTDCPPLSRS